MAEADADYNVDDLLDPIRGALSLNGELYGVPFYGESSFVMFNQEIMDAGIPEFPDIGTRCTQEIRAAIAGQQSLDIALDACQAIASEVSQ